MALTVDFVPFATGGSANVTSQADYIAESTTGTGFISGVASSADCNKAWRQGTFQAAVLATVVSNTLGISVLDDGNLSNGVTNLQSALDSIADTQASSVVSSALGSLTLPFSKITGTISNTQFPATISPNTTGNAATATLASTVTTSASATNTNYAVALCNGTSIVYSASFTYNPSTKVLTTGGPLVSTTGQFTSSDEKLKENFRRIQNPMDILDAVEGTVFDWISRKDVDPFRTSVGFRAQQFQRAFPQLVYVSEDGTLQLNYDGATAVLWEAVKALRCEVKALRSELMASRGEP